MVHRVDTELGDLLAAIDNNTAAPGLKDRTAFFVSSDHGDFSGNHHLVEKWPGAVDDLLTHVPFVARMPTPEYLPFHKGTSPAKGAKKDPPSARETRVPRFTSTPRLPEGMGRARDANC